MLSDAVVSNETDDIIHNTADNRSNVNVQLDQDVTSLSNLCNGQENGVYQEEQRHELIEAREQLQKLVLGAFSSYSELTSNLGEYLYSTRKNVLRNFDSLIDKTVPLDETSIINCKTSAESAGIEQLFPNDEAASAAILPRYLLKEKTLLKYGRLLDIVDNSSKRSCCFTKGYSRQVEGTGSVFNPTNATELRNVFDELDRIREACRNPTLPIPAVVKDSTRTVKSRAEVLMSPTCSQDENSQRSSNLLKSLGLRHFSPPEALRLMGFPEWFQFPKIFSDRQLYQLIGNSVNVLVVAVLMAELMGQC